MLLPVKSVGVMGDERTYEKCVALRAVESTDGMTADWVDLPYKFLQDISNKIIDVSIQAWFLSPMWLEIIPRAAELIALSSDAFKINSVFSYEVDIPKK